jgi:chromosome segregation protein
MASEEENIKKLGGLFEEVSVKMERIQGELIDLKQTQLDFLQDQARVKSSAEHYEKVLGDLDTRSKEMRERIVSLEAETASIAGERDARQSALSEAQKVLSSLEEENRERIARLEQVEAESASNASTAAEKKESLAGMKSRYELFNRMREDFEGFPGGARHILRKGDERVLGPLAEMISVKKEHRRALEAALGGLMDGVLVDSVGGAVDIARELSDGKMGGARFLADDPSWEGSGSRSGVSGMLGPFSSFVETSGRAGGAVGQLLDGVYLFEDLDSAVSFVASKDGEGCSAVTVSGIYYSRGRGIYFSGSPGEEVSIFGRTEEMERLAGEMKAVEEEIAGLEKKGHSLKGEKDSIRDRIEEISRISTRAREELAARRQAFEEIEREFIMGREKASMMMKALDELENSRVEAMSRLEEARLALAMQQGAGDISDTERLESELAGFRKNREELDSDLTSRKVRLASLQGTLDRQNEELRGLGEMEKQFRGIVEQRTVEIKSAREETARLERSIEEERTGVKGSLEEESAYESEIGSMHDVLEEKRELIGGIEGELKARKAERESIFEKINDLRVTLSSIETRMNDLVDRGRELYNEDLGGYLEGLETPLTEEEKLITKEMLDSEKRKLDSLGPVNLAAVEEYEEKKERFEFLTSQKDDLVAARAELEEAIRKINRRARKMFIETFELVKGHFSSIFEVLFEGGQADLHLGEGSDPLEADIIIRARPKGKRIQDISLLSGGERALTALALLFALYKAKPSPFCIFDEVDAPLDDSNIQRFVRMLRKFSEDTQFIIITHNKRTMEAADQLFGITMEEKGVSRIVSVDLTEIEDLLAKRKPASSREKIAEPVSSN